MRRSGSQLCVLLGLLSGWSAGCAAPRPAPVVAPAAPVPAVPSWVNRGSGAFHDGSFYGVGIAQGIRNRSLAVSTADDRARASIAAALNTYVVRLAKSWQESTSDMQQSGEGQVSTEAIKSFVAMNLTGATIIDHFRDPSDGTQYALCKLELAMVQQTLAQASGLDARVRDHFKANAAKGFEELAAEEAKRGR